LGICRIEEIEATEYKTLSHVYPIYALDYESKLKRVYGALKNYRNLYPIGRLGGFYFCMMYDAINQGIETAEHILSQEQKP
jgi:protoporphyrinogen oxidase